MRGVKGGGKGAAGWSYIMRMNNLGGIKYKVGIFVLVCHCILFSLSSLGGLRDRKFNIFIFLFGV